MMIAACRGRDGGFGVEAAKAESASGKYSLIISRSRSRTLNIEYSLILTLIFDPGSEISDPLISAYQAPVDKPN